MPEMRVKLTRLRDKQHLRHGLQQLIELIFERAFAAGDNGPAPIPIHLRDPLEDIRARKTRKTHAEHVLLAANFLDPFGARTGDDEGLLFDAKSDPRVVRHGWEHAEVAEAAKGLEPADVLFRKREGDSSERAVLFHDEVNRLLVKFSWTAFPRDERGREAFRPDLRNGFYARTIPRVWTHRALDSKRFVPRRSIHERRSLEDIRQVAGRSGENQLEFAVDRPPWQPVICEGRECSSVPNACEPPAAFRRFTRVPPRCVLRTIPIRSEFPGGSPNEPREAGTRTRRLPA